MGISCKPTGRFQSIMKKMENELARQEKLAKEEKKEARKDKKSR